LEFYLFMSKMRWGVGPDRQHQGHEHIDSAERGHEQEDVCGCHDADLALDHVSELLQAAGRAGLSVGQERRRILWQEALGLDGPKPVLADLIDEAVGMKGAAPPRDEFQKPGAAGVSQTAREVEQGRGEWALLRFLHSIGREHQQ
jgi:hypothetical protein